MLRYLTMGAPVQIVRTSLPDMNLTTQYDNLCKEAWQHILNCQVPAEAWKQAAWKLTLGGIAAGTLVDIFPSAFVAGTHEALNHAAPTLGHQTTQSLLTAHPTSKSN